MVISQKSQLCAHDFGSISSGTCSDYALKRTAKENEKKYGTETACTTSENFYFVSTQRMM